MKNNKAKLVWRTEKRKIKDLIPYKGNPRRMTEKQQKDLENSLAKFNLVEIPAIDTDNKIIAGHQRLKILKLLGRGEEIVDVRIPSRKLTNQEFKEYNLRSNKNLGEWDFDLLANFDEELLLDVGFGSGELDEIFQLDEEDNFDIDKEYEKIKKPKTKLGDLYKLEEHRLLCGDAIKKDDVDKLMNNSKAKLCFTSPPYNMAGGLYSNYTDNLKREKFIGLHIDSVNNIKRHLKGFLFWNVSYNSNARSDFLEILYKIIKETGLKFIELIIWDKGHGMPITSKKGLTRQYEDILLVGDENSIQKDLEVYMVGTTSRSAYFNKKTNRGITNYWRIGTNRSQVSNLRACFPIALPKRGIELMTNRGDIVVDLFGGSGTTLIATEQLNRKCYMMELDPVYCDLIVNRWEAFTNNKAEKING